MANLPFLSMAALRTTTAPVNQYYISDANKQGHFEYDSSLISPIDDGAMIIVNTPTGKGFKRVFEGPVNVKWFGAGSGTVNDDVAINNAINFVVANYATISTTTIYIPPGSYTLNAPIVIPPLPFNPSDGESISIKIIGSGVHSTILAKSGLGTYTGSSTTRIAPERPTKTDSMANIQAAIVIDHADSKYADNITISDMTLVSGTIGSIAVSNMYAIYAPRASALTLARIKAYNFRNGYFTYLTWLSTFSSLRFLTFGNHPAPLDDPHTKLNPDTDSPYVGFNFSDDTSGGGTGTSNTFTSCLVAGYNYGFAFLGLNYSSLISCATSDILGTPYFFNTCHQITLSACGAEKTFLNAGAFSSSVIHIEGSDGIIVNAFLSQKITPDTDILHNSSALSISSSTVVFNGGNFDNFITNTMDTLNIILQNASSLASNALRLPENGHPFISFYNGSSWDKTSRISTQFVISL